MIKGKEFLVKVLSIFGTRPEAIKMAPVVKELEKRDNLESYVCVTAQHREMLDQILEIFDIKPDFDLNIMHEKQSICDITRRAMTGIYNLLGTLKPDLVLVHGDTTTAFCGALSAFYQKIPVGHVEAGLRTNNIYSPYPEEFNREAISLIAKYNFAPTIQAKENLIKEGKTSDIIVTGNTSIDALKMIVDETYENNIFDCAKGKKLILLTAHRRENLGKPMENIFLAVNKITEQRKDLHFIFPVHKNPLVREIANKYFSDNPAVQMIEPLDVYNFQNIMARCHFVLTDSGGIQEEAPGLGIPVLVLRDTTERPEGIEAGTLKLVGTDSEKIFNNVMQLLDSPEEYKKMSNATNPYGDGLASKRIVDYICEL